MPCEGGQVDQEVNVHLSQACVDLQGNLVCDGFLSFPPDEGGKFERKDSTQVVVDRDRMTVSACSAARHSSGFYESNSSGALLGIPASLATLIRHALQFGAKQTVVSTIESQHGELYSSSRWDHRFRQPLSKWDLRISEVSGIVTVEISALMFGADIRDWLSSEDNFWTSQSRISAQFSVDPLTRNACCDAYVGELDVPDVGNTLNNSSKERSGVSLALASVGISNFFGIAQTKYIDVGIGSESRSYLAFTEHSNVYRLSNGYLSRGNYRWPRVWFRGVQIRSLLEMDERPVRFSGDGLQAYAEKSGHSSHWREDATDAFCEVSLVPAGMTLTYEVITANHRLGEELVVPWSTLLLKLPMLGSKWEKIVA